jgi:hypothetical protein
MKGNKSCVESCDKANELILKAKVRNMGESIDVIGKKRSPRSLYIHEALDILENKRRIKIPEHEKLVRIHERRNPTYHRGTSVSRANARSCLKTTYKFIKRFLKDEFRIELRDIVKAEYYEVLEGNISKTRQRIGYINKAETKLYKIDEARSEMLKDYRNIETELNRLVKKLNLHEPLEQQPLPKNRSLSMSKNINVLISNKKLPRKTRRYFATIRALAYKAANTQKKITRDEHERFVVAMIRLKVQLEKLG